MSSLNVYLVNAGIIRYGMKEQPYRCTAFNSVYEFHITMFAGRLEHIAGPR